MRGNSMKNEKDVLILAIESSCDETAAAVVKNGRTVLSNVINTQIAIHTEYGGVVPEIASRKHIENINPVIREALKEADVTLDDITAIGVTYGPGLVGALLVGVAEAKAIAFATDKPLVGVHHIEGHIAANYIENKELKPPFVALVVSGGHTHLVKVVDYGRYEIIGKWLDEGIEFCCTDGVSIGNNVTIGHGTKIHSGVILRGNTTIGENCNIGNNCIIENTTVGNGVNLNNVQAYESVIEDDVKIGPYVQLRPNSHIKKGAKIGDFVEIKNSTIGEYTAVAHLTYIGDSDVGSNVNFGCGVVTVNYNGDKKFRTVIEDNAFIGCNTNLVAPVRVGKGAYTAAGSTITTDIPDNALAIERGRETIKEGYAEKKLKARTEKFEAIHGKSEEK